MIPATIPLTLALTIPPLLLIEGFFSGSEIAILSSDRLSLRKRAKQGDRGAARALELANHPERVLSTTLLITSLSIVASSALVALHLLAQGYAHAEFLSVLITSPLIVIFGELIPKTLFQRRANLLAPWVSGPVSTAYWVLYPLTRLLALYTSRLAKIIGPVEELLSGKRKNTREELKSLLAYGKKESEIKSSEKRIIRRILDFKDSEAKHALIPLVKVEAIESGSSLLEALERFESHRHSRMPVFEGRVDNIVGILEAADLLTHTGNQTLPGLSDARNTIRDIYTPPHYVAETQSLEDVLTDMHRESMEMVIVVDEHGGAIGILTSEDIVEEIVGEISDEYDTESMPFRTLSEHSWQIQSRMEIAAINEILKFELPTGDYETLGGFLLQQFGRIPEARDELFFHTPNGEFKFTIRQATERQIESVVVERTPKTPASND